MRWLWLLLLLPLYAQAADHTVSAGTSTVDCDTFDGGVNPGDTLTLAAGTRGRLSLVDCRGTAGNRITVRNDTTGAEPTVILDPGTAGNGFTFSCHDCEHITIDGTGKWVGAPAGECGWNNNIEGTTQCGIQVRCCTGNLRPNFLMRFGGSSTDFTVQGVEMDGGFPTASGGSLGTCAYVRDGNFTLTDNPNFWRENILFDKNYCHDTGGSSHYIGPNTFNDEPPVRNVVISNSLQVNIGRRGPTIKTGIEGTNEVKYNKVVNTGINLGGLAARQHGIYIFEGAGNVYNNYVEDAGETGIACYMFTSEQSSSEVYECNIYNNIVINSGTSGPGSGHGISVGRSGTDVPDYDANVYNNTVIDNPATGITVNNNVQTVAFVQDNIVCNSGSSDISTGSGAAHVATSNQTGACSSQGFESYPSDLHLASGSSAISDSVFSSPPSEDFDFVTRPQGADVDDGAYEFIESGGPGGGGEDITAPKPTTTTIDTGEAHYPDYLYIFNEGSGTTVEDEGGATDCDLTISGATWGSDAYGNYLTFDGVNDTAANTSCSALHQFADPMVMCAIVRIDSLPGAVQTIGGIYDSGDEDQEASIKVRTSGSPQASVVDTGGVAFDNNVFSPAIVDSNLKMVCVRQGNADNDGSVNGSGFDESVIALSQLFTGSQTIGVGARQRQSTDQYFAGDVYAFWVYASDKTDANIATIHNSGDPWAQIGVDPSSGPPPVLQRGQDKVAGDLAQ